MSRDFAVTKTDEGVWRVEGDLDLATAPAFEQAFAAEAGSTSSSTCSGLLFMDSQGVRSVMVVAAPGPPVAGWCCGVSRRRCGGSPTS